MADAQTAVLFELDPLRDWRWNKMVFSQPSASVFHTPGWLRALEQTYGFEPTVVTTSPPDRNITNALVFCRIRGALGGERWVSLPFTDHCEPFGHRTERTELTEALFEQVCNKKSVEIRALTSEDFVPHGFVTRDSFVLHTLDLRPKLNSIFNSFHKDCIQRKIRKAERERLICREGGIELLDEFFRLYLMTRRRHGVPPAPRLWFRNVIVSLGKAAKLRLAFQRDQAVAGMLTLAHGCSLVYKYGCSDAAKNRLGGMPLLFWKAIQDAKHDGITTFDLGRSELNASGLITFKERLGATGAVLQYVGSGCRSIIDTGLARRVAAVAFRFLPEPLLIGAGRLLYPRIG